MLGYDDENESLHTCPRPLGRLNREELTSRIASFIKGPTIRMHNQLLLAMYGNSSRDLPPTDVAAWVSATDKPSALSKMPAGDVNEKRLKKEVMAISARERRRIKEVPMPVCFYPSSRRPWGQLLTINSWEMSKMC